MPEILDLEYDRKFGYHEDRMKVRVILPSSISNAIKKKQINPERILNETLWQQELYEEHFIDPETLKTMHDGNVMIYYVGLDSKDPYLEKGTELKIGEMIPRGKFRIMDIPDRCKRMFSILWKLHDLNAHDVHRTGHCYDISYCSDKYFFSSIEANLEMARKELEAFVKEHPLIRTGRAYKRLLERF